jgi:hypothetical protein
MEMKRKICENEEKTSLRLRECMWCTAGGYRDDYERDSCCDGSVHEFLGEVRKVI